jgi:glycosyltransferase involved in cell wall biosynthesis
MIRNPLVSIVIPVYNQKATFLRECIESALNQTYSNIEVVISDNHSNNNSLTIITEYKLIDDRIRIVRPDSFLNMSDSFLFALSMAKGKYSCYLSSDDILLPNCISVLTSELELKPESLFAHGKALYFDKDGNEQEKWDYFPNGSGEYSFNKEIAIEFLNFNYVCFAGCLIRNSNLSSILGYYNSNKPVIEHFLDLELTFKMFELGNVYFANEVLAKVRIENDSRNSLNTRLIFPAVQIWKNYNLSSFFNLKNNGIDMLLSIKNKQFNVFLKSVYVEFLKNQITQKEFTENLKLLLSTHFYSNAIKSNIIKLSLVAPNLIKLILKLIFTLNRIFKNFR